MCFSDIPSAPCTRKLAHHQKNMFFEHCTRIKLNDLQGRKSPCERGIDQLESHWRL